MALVLGTLDRQLLRHDGDEHVLVIAPTNTGKSVGISLPTGLVWRHSYLALDLKGENWSVTSGLRKAFAPSTALRQQQPTPIATTHSHRSVAVRRRSVMRRSWLTCWSIQKARFARAQPLAAARLRTARRDDSFDALCREAKIPRTRWRVAGRSDAPCARSLRRDVASPNQGWRGTSGRCRRRLPAPGHG